MKYANIGLFDVRELRQLRDENARLNPLVADLTRDRQVLQELINKDLATPMGREIAQWIRNLATERPRFDYDRIHVLLKREGWEVNPKRVHRLYKLDGLHLRMRVRRPRRISLHRTAPPVAPAGGQYWAMDFVHDQLSN